MGLFDLFKKNESSDTKEDLTVDVKSRMPVPFEDPEYRSLFINYTAEVTLSSKNPAEEISDRSDIISTKAETAVNMAISRMSFPYRDFEAQSSALVQELRTALPEYDIKSFRLLTFEPDEMSVSMIKQIDQMKIASDPDYAAKIMQEAMDAAGNKPAK